MTGAYIISLMFHLMGLMHSRILQQARLIRILARNWSYCRFTPLQQERTFWLLGRDAQL